mgnify:CR=1 FL=1
MGNYNEYDNTNTPSPQERIPSVVPDFDALQKKLGIYSASDLNKAINSGDVNNMINLQDESHGIQIQNIASAIASGNEHKKVLLIAGPSSSGKTTFAKKLDLKLQERGVYPVTISLDSYFVERGLAPRHLDGSENLEALEALDYKLFNQNLASLIEGEEVEIPRFSFKTSSRMPEGVKMQLKDHQIIVVEGRHAINFAPRLLLIPLICGALLLRAKKKIYCRLKILQILYLILL